MELYAIAIRVKDWPQAVSWYRDVLGLNVVLVDEEHQYALLEASSGRIALKAGTPLQNPSVRLTFRVESLESEQSRLMAHGVSVGQMTTNAVEGFREIRLHDPDGTPIAIFEWTPPNHPANIGNT